MINLINSLMLSNKLNKEKSNNNNKGILRLLMIN